VLKGCLGGTVSSRRVSGGNGCSFGIHHSPRCCSTCVSMDTVSVSALDSTDIASRIAKRCPHKDAHDAIRTTSILQTIQ
jgi:hypothetical protein